MSTISRRSALLGGAAGLATAATTIPLAFKAVQIKEAWAVPAESDAELLALSRQFWRTLRQHDRLWTERKRLRAEFHAREGHGPDAWAEDFEARQEEYMAKFERDISSRYYDRACALHKECGRLANAIFALPAHTPQGVLAKFRIVYRAAGDYRDAPNHDADLDALIDEDAPWMVSLGRDLERMAG